MFTKKIQKPTDEEVQERKDLGRAIENFFNNKKTAEVIEDVLNRGEEGGEAVE